MIGRVLPRRFYKRDAISVAKDLLGKVLRHGATAGIIVETEAYLGGDDLAAHSARGLTDRTKIIFGPPGYAYVYLIYGIYDCMNVVADREGTPGCVLLRAVEPLTGIDLMQERRPAATRPEQLASGPGKLTRALGISRDHNGSDLTTGPIWIHCLNPPRQLEIETTCRIGITQCADWPLRYTIAGSPYVSR